MRCVRCGAEVPALKTCRWRSGNGSSFALCDACHAPISGVLWVIPGPGTVFARCTHCGGWYSLRDMAAYGPGGARDAYAGTCTMCAEKEEG
jgi:hypothetical protein